MVAGDDDTEAIIQTFLADNSDCMVCVSCGPIDCAPCDILGDDKHHLVHNNRMLGP